MNIDSEYRHPVEELAEEFAERIRNGENPSIREYAEKHPQIAQEIRAAFGALQIIERAAVARKPLPKATATVTAMPDRLGEFRIIGEIGRGGMGVVYKAIQEPLGREVALKVLPGDALQDETQKQRFLREAQAAARLHHTNIAPVFAVGEQDGRPYFAMQYIRGVGLDEMIGDLHRRSSAIDTPEPTGVKVGSTIGFGGSILAANSAKKREVSSSGDGPAIADDPSRIGSQTERKSETPDHFRSVARIGIQAAEALAYAHQHGILHRDIKPANLMLDAAGVVWVMDFGLAKLSSDTDMAEKNLTATGAVVGTLRYLPPERFGGTTDARGDVYSLGLTLYELLAGRPAFAESDQHRLLRQIVDEQPPLLRSNAPGLPRDLDTVIRKAIDKDPGRRYFTAQEFADDLRRFLEDRPVIARRIQPWERVWRWARRNPMAAAFFLSVLLLVLGGSSAAVWYANDRAGRFAESAARQALQAKRSGRIEQKIVQALQEAKTLQEESWSVTRSPHLWEAKLSSALGAVKRAEGILATAPKPVDPELEKDLRILKMQVKSNNADRQLVVSLKKIWEDQTRVFYTKGWAKLRAGTSASYRDAFARRGLQSGMPITAALAWLNKKRTPVRQALIAGFFDWYRTAERGPEHDAELQWISQVLDSAVADPWGKRLLAAMRQNDQTTLIKLADDVSVAEQRPATLVVMSVSLRDAGLRNEAVMLARRALEQYPDEIMFSDQLGFLLWRESPDQAEAFYRMALALQPRNAAIWSNIGAVRLAQGNVAGALAALKKSREYDTSNAATHFNLGYAWNEHGNIPAAINAYRKALECNPRLTAAYFNLGGIYRKQERLVEAVGAFKNAAQYGPNDAIHHYFLGQVLHQHGDIRAAVAAFRTAVDCNPQHFKAWNNLGVVLNIEGDATGSLAAFKKAVACAPQERDALYNLGMALKASGDLRGTAALLQKLVAANPKFGQAYSALAKTLVQSGRFDEARKTIRQFQKHFSATSPSAQRDLALCDRLLARKKRLGDILTGNAAPRDVTERLSLADFCRRYNQPHSAAARFYMEAFAMMPATEDIWRNGRSFAAARCAALAANGKDADKRDEQHRAVFRKQALTWLNAELAYWNRKLDNEYLLPGFLADVMVRWQTIRDFAHLRDEEGLHLLTESDRQQFRRFWAQVEILRRRDAERFRETNITYYLLSNQRSKSHTLPTTAGKTYQIDMKSTMFDAILNLQDAHGKMMASDDDSGRGRDARITFTCKSGGDHELTAASNGQRGIGRYTIRIREFKKP